MHDERMETSLKTIVLTLTAGMTGLVAIEALLSIFDTAPSRSLLFSAMTLRLVMIGTIFFSAWFIYFQHRGFSLLSMMLLAGAVTWGNYWAMGIFDSIAMNGRPSFIERNYLAPWELTWYTSLWFKSLPMIAMATAGGILVWREKHFSF